MTQDTTSKTNPTPRTDEKTSQEGFALGSLVATPAALDALTEAGQSPQEFIARHLNLEQGELCDEDQQANKVALVDGSRIFSAFKTAKGEKVWVITEADRSATTILLPSEY